MAHLYIRRILISWGGQRTGITITMWDPENAIHWAEESLVGFTLENEGYQYSDVASY